MKTHFYLVRHGQSDGNLRNVFLGHTDLDLTPLGYEQARMTAAYLEDIPADVIYSSDLLRAYHTALATAEQKNMEVICDPRFREVNAGEWENVPFSQLKEKYPHSFDLWCHFFGESYCDGGESTASLSERVLSVMKEMAQKHEGQTVFIFTHATPIRVLGGLYSGKTLEELNDFPWPSNASVTHVTCENGVFSLSEYSIDFFMGEFCTRLD